MYVRLIGFMILERLFLANKKWALFRNQGDKRYTLGLLNHVHVLLGKRRL